MTDPVPRLPPEASTLPTPPDSPRKRRRELRESDDASGEMSIEQYLYRSDPYRSTSVPNPLPYPLVANCASESVKTRIQAYYSDILSILRDHGFQDRPLFAVDEVTKPGYPSGDTPVVMLRLKFRFQDVVPRVLGDAKDAIHSFLISHDIDGVHVEIVHLDRCFLPSLFAIDPSHHAVVIYEEIKRQLIDHLDVSLGSSWRVLSIFNVGRTEDNALPTIVVMVDPGTICDFSSLEHSIKRLLHAPTHISIAVEFLPGGASPLTTPPREEEIQEGDPGTSFLWRMSRDGHPKLGFSIGIKGERGGGTMGGFVTLSQNGITHKGILTNYHVIRPPSSSDKPLLLQADQFGSSMFKRDATQVEVLYFADKDIKATLQDADNSICDRQEQLEKDRAEQRERKMVGARPSVGVQNRIEYLEEQLTEFKEKQQIVRSMPFTLGKVLVSSGKSLVNNRILDWAFVEATNPAGEKFFGPNRMPAIPPPKIPSMYTRRTLFAPEGVPLVEFGGLEKGSYYVKIGRTSNLTAGVCNGALAYCNWSERDGIRYDEKGTEVKVADNRTEEYVILDKSTRQTEHTQASFCEAGDSGSFIIDGNGKVCGLLYGELSGRCGPPGNQTTYVQAGLATSMPDIIESIRSRTTPRNANGSPAGSPAILALPVETTEALG
ncbi:hypothetical protein VTN77DRAFT_6893 [Rasamsonia byssochlamydoides]|uniref:uncharacterized protein n=1 Tax=Rasamsonia byssochlamydoides TaxID=89139 RepID=UPI0037430CF1